MHCIRVSTNTFFDRQAQYERQLKKWGFRKNLTSNEWAYVAREIEKRTFEGRDSEVIVDGKLVPKEKVQKKISVYGYQTTLEKLDSTLRSKLMDSFPERAILLKQ